MVLTTRQSLHRITNVATWPAPERPVGICRTAAVGRGEWIAQFSAFSTINNIRAGYGRRAQIMNTPIPVVCNPKKAFLTHFSTVPEICPAGCLFASMSRWFAGGEFFMAFIGFLKVALKFQKWNIYQIHATQLFIYRKMLRKFQKLVRTILVFMSVPRAIYIYVFGPW